MMALGIIAQRLRTSAPFDRGAGRITNDTLASQLLVGAPPRTDWEQFYKL
jgi:hypothetical protein